MDNKEFGRLLEVRTRNLAVSIIRLSKLLPVSPEGNIIRSQFTKAGTSIGANYREANRARSKPDFVSRMKICQSEASEALYWLEIISDMNWIASEKTDPAVKELNELLAIFAHAGKTLNQRK